MAVSLTVSQVRQALHSHAGFHSNPSGAGTPTTAALGTIFHSVAADLIHSDSPRRIQSLVSDLKPDLSVWKHAVREIAYDQILGPILTRQSAALQGHGGSVLRLWTAVEQLTEFLCDLWWTITDKGSRSPEQSDWWTPEQPIVCELHREDWPEPVLLIGQADAILRVPGPDHWCVIDWKTGRTSPELDLLQACLYHLILQQMESTNDSSALAVISFQPELSQSVFSHTKIAPVRDRLLDLIGKLATSPQSTNPSSSIQTAPTITTPTSSRQNTIQAIPKPNSPLDPLSPSDDRSGHSVTWQQSTLERLLGVLEESGAPCRQVRDSAVGPAFVRFYVTPRRGITTRRIMASSEQLHLRLSLNAEPVMSIDEGAVAIDLPRPDRQLIPMSELIPLILEIDHPSGNALLPIGVDLTGKWHWCDLSASESSHLLVVGTPGSGKTEWLRVALATLLMTNDSSTLDLRLIDPKRNAFTFAESHPLLSRPIWMPGQSTDASELLEELVAQMQQRNELLQQSNSRTLQEHIEKTGEAVPRVIVICDEYADLLDGASKPERQAIEGMFKRIAQVGRAPGFHLVLATQQPRANVISTSIRSLLPAKIAMRVSDGTESRVAIEQKGAEQLLGNGDLLYKCIGIHRLQGAWLPTQQESLVCPSIASRQHLAT